MSSELETVAAFLTGSGAEAERLPWRSLRSDDLRVVGRWAREALPGAHRRRVLRELRRVLREAPEPDEPFEVTGRAVPRLRTGVEGTRPPLSLREARLLLAVCRDASGAPAARDAAILSLMLLAGFRPAEVVSLRRGDYDETDASLTVRSRRAGLRSVLLRGECLAAVEAWAAFRGSSPGPFFLACNARGETTSRGIAASTVGRIVRERGREAGIEGVRAADLRARFLRQLRSGAPASCRYFLAEDGQPGWALASLPAL
ncbi:MAG TPA: site-specific integrase [Dehalococcoidia bacterium]|nr:site-specific integrase [Dehalococcoidia bacterium]